jgi:hypothetical protein
MSTANVTEIILPPAFLCRLPMTHIFVRAPSSQAAVFNVILKILYFNRGGDDFPWKCNATDTVWHARRNPNNMNAFEILKLN